MEYVKDEIQKRLELTKKSKKSLQEEISLSQEWVVLFNTEGNSVSGLVKKIRKNRIYLFDRFVGTALSSFRQEGQSLKADFDDYQFLQIIGVPDLRTHCGLGRYVAWWSLLNKDLILFSNSSKNDIGFIYDSMPALNSDLIQKFLRSLDFRDIQNRFYIHATLSNPKDCSSFTPKKEVYSLDDQAVIHALRYNPEQNMYHYVRE